MGITVLFNSNRLVANASFTEAMMASAKLGRTHLETDPARWRQNTLYLSSSAADTAKDARRAATARHFCVVAMGGDQLGDFFELFNAETLSPGARRQAADSPALEAVWGSGWFLFPNPVYGTALTGTIDQVFPAKLHWTDVETTPTP